MRRARKSFSALARHAVSAIAFVASVAFVPSAAFAASDDSKIIFPGATTPAGTTAMGGGLGSVTLLVGLALAGLGTWLVWRARSGSPVGRDLRALSIHETRSLGNRQFLVVASYEDKKFLLGVCPGQINLLVPLGEKEPRA